ncbi:hypothetical protein OKW09_001711 [Pseudomonas rhodesiae]|jgi:hypothetical protein|nr:hypothetical protein [Pseudomonas rhodesiae]MDF9769426.1 hypothetical protein [Pseudomonas rhodesiae]
MSNEKTVTEVDLAKVFSLNGENGKVVLAVVN